MQGEVVGFIGLGAMGGPMAANLVNAGYTVAGFDLAPARLSAARARGVTVMGSCLEVAKAATSTVISIVRDAVQTSEVLHGSQGVIAAGRSGLDLAVMSTLDPTTMRELAEDLASSGITAVDGPVSGGVAGAEQGTLAILTSGDPAALERLRPLLETMGKHVFYLGERPGMGQAAKLANQVMLAVSMLGVREGVRIASSHGVDEEQLMRLLAVSTGDSWAARNWDRVRGFWERYVPGNELDIIRKDLRSAFREADRQEWSLPITAAVYEQIQTIENAG